MLSQLQFKWPRVTWWLGALSRGSQIKRSLAWVTDSSAEWSSTLEVNGCLDTEKNYKHFVDPVIVMR
jgi:hypothetical protein